MLSCGPGLDVGPGGNIPSGATTESGDSPADDAATDTETDPSDQPSCVTDDPTEPNDTIEEAYSLKNDARGSLCHHDEKDIYVLDVESTPTNVEIAVEFDKSIVNKIRATVSIIDRNGAEVLASSGDTGHEDDEIREIQVRTRIDEPGRYFARIKGRLDDEQVVTYRVTWIPDSACWISMCPVDLDGTPHAAWFSSGLATDGEKLLYELPIAGRGCERNNARDSTWDWYLPIYPHESGGVPYAYARHPLFVACEPGESIDYGDLLVPPLPPGVPISGMMRLAIDDKLTLELDAEHLDFGFDPKQLAGTRIPAKWWPRHVVLDLGRVLAMWTFGPWVISDVPVAVEIHESFGLEAGDTVTFWTFGSRDYSDYGVATRRGEGVVDGEMIRTTNGGLRDLSWFAVLRGD